MSNLYTKEGHEALKQLRLNGVETEKVKDILAPLDNLLSNKIEVLRQYEMCYGKSHNWWSAHSERLRVAKQALEEAEENYNLLRDHNL